MKRCELTDAQIDDAISFWRAIEHTNGSTVCRTILALEELKQRRVDDAMIDAQLRRLAEIRAAREATRELSKCPSFADIFQVVREAYKRK